MEKINTEELITALFMNGFDRVDPILFTYTLGKISTDKEAKQSFGFEDRELSAYFNEYVTCDNGAYQIVADCDMDTFVLIGDTNIQLKKLLHTNKKLIAYLAAFDFSEIILKKIMLLGDNKVGNLDKYFCDKEREIIAKMFGINEMYQRRTIRQEAAYERIYNEEASELDKIVIDQSIIDKKIARDEELVKLGNSYDYIDWLKAFTDKHGNIDTDYFEYDRRGISDEDYQNVNKLSIFYDVIDEYVGKKNSNANNVCGEYSYSINYDMVGFKIGFVYGRGTIFYCDRIEPSENAIDFSDIVKYNTKKKRRIRKKNI